MKQIVTVACGFILPRYMLLYFGSSINGLVSSITHFLSFITLLDMGVGAVVMSNLYKPLADNDIHHISLIVKSSKRFFKRISYIFIAYIFILCVLYPTILGTTYEAIFTITLIVVISISTLAQYLFGMTYQLLLNADQKSYIPMLLHSTTIILNTLFAIAMMKCGATIHQVKLMTAGVYIIRPVGQMLYVRKKYPLDYAVVLNDEPIKQKWNGFAQHLASVIVENVDIVALTLYSTLENISVYTVYFTVTNGVEKLIMTAATGLESMFGNMLAMGESENLQKTFNIVEWITHTVVTIVFTVTAITIVPFVQVYTRHITDTNYIAPLFSSLLVLAYAAFCLRIPYFRLIKAAGHFKQTQVGAYISAILNVVVTICMVSSFGLVGAATGTLIAMAYHTCYFVKYLSLNILYRKWKIFIKYIFTDGIAGLGSFLIARLFFMRDCSYSGWMIFFFKIILIVLAVSMISNLIFYRAEINYIKMALERRINHVVKKEQNF